MPASRARFRASFPAPATVPVLHDLTADEAALFLVDAIPGVPVQVASDALAALALGHRDSIGDHRIIITRDRDADPERDRIQADAAQWRRENGTASSADWARS